MKITVLIPVFNERETLAPLVEGIRAQLSDIEHCILFVDDGSTDGSHEELLALRERHPAIEVISFRRNYGKTAALAAGFERAEGDLLFTMDADLQDDPKEIPRFLEKLQEGYDVVCGWKAVRHDPWHKTFPSKVYNRFVSRVSGLAIHDINCGFKLFRMEVVKNLSLYGDMHRLIPVFAEHLGYRVGEITVEHHPRTYGVSKYGIERFSRGAIDVLTAFFLTHHLFSPGHFFGKVGFGMMAVGLVALVAAGVGALAALAPLLLAALALSAVMLGVGGMVMLGAGLVAELLLRHIVQSRKNGADTLTKAD